VTLQAGGRSQHNSVIPGRASARTRNPAFHIKPGFRVPPAAAPE
jgi:hypothetical protein